MGDGASPSRPALGAGAPGGGCPGWLEVSLSPALAQERRELVRAMRRGGAVCLWAPPGQARGIWPDTPQAREAIAALPLPAGAAAPLVEGFQALDPKVRWAQPPCQRLHPRLKLAEAWSGLPASADTLVIDPLTAFGAGDHPSTRLNLRLLAELLSADPPAGVRAGAWAADVGAGTGVLALAMALLAGLKVLALDPEAASARAVARNRALNPLAGPLVHFVRGYHDILGGRVPLIAANLPGPILLTVAEHMTGCLAPGGRLVASGFREEFAPRLEEHCAGLGLRAVQRAREAGWEGIVFSYAGGAFNVEIKCGRG